MSRSVPSRQARHRRRQNRRHRSPRTSLRCESLEPRMMLNADMGDLSALNDEFNDPATIDDWQLVSQAEGWGAQHFETYDIDQTTPGALTIAPYTSTWYQDYQGDLSFKEVSGDFIVTTQVTIRDRDDVGGSDGDDIPNDSSFSLGGVMLRTPRGISDAAAEWTPGGSNFVFLSLGHGYDGNMTLESKTTVDSDSNLELIPVNETSAELRIERVGSSITTMYRLAGDADWQAAATFDRPDMPATLQVGLLGYSDYGKTSTFDPFYANSHTLTDTPENAANSSNPGLAYNQDLQASFDYIRFERPEDGEVVVPPGPALEVREVTVSNASFEDIAGETPFNEFTFGPLPGWDLYDPGAITSGGAGPQYYIGTLTPTELAEQPGVIQNFPGGASDGDRVAIAFNFAGTGDGGEYGLQQTLAETLQPNTSYALSVDIGNIATGTAVSGQTFYLDGLPGYRVELLAGDTVIAVDDNSLAGSIAEGEFGLSTVSLDIGDVHPQLGEALGIRLINLNQTADVPAGHDLEVDFDNVRLTATSAAFAQVGDQQVHANETLVIELAPTTPAGVPVEYSIEVVGAELWELDQTLGLEAGGYAADGTPLYYEDYEGYGVRWLQSDVNGWMFLQSDGSLHDWQGSIGTSPLVASLSEDVFADPSLLHDAVEPATATMNGITAFVDASSTPGTFEVAITKTAGELTEVEIVSVEVTNTGPELPVIGDQVLAAGETLLVDLPIVDADGDQIEYEVEVLENVAATLRDDFAIHADASLVASDYGYNYLGQQERWVQSSAGWMFITAAGSVHSWSGDYASSPAVAQLDSRYHADPGLLVSAVHIDVSATVVAGQLQLSVATDYLGELHIRLIATDGIETVQQSFTVDHVASAWAGMVDDAFEDEDFWV